MSRVRLPGVEISSDDNDIKAVTLENLTRSFWGVSMRFHKFVNAFPSWCSYKYTQHSEGSNFADFIDLY